MKLVFMGTPDFAARSLTEIIAAGHDVVCVYTQPPRRAGRGKKVQESPVHILAERMGLDVRTPVSFRRSSFIDEFAALKPDAACVVAYGQILPQRALTAPRFGCLNLHASLLPRWRGAAPIQRAIMAGDTHTGVQIMQMGKGLDTGDILLSEITEIAKDETAGTLTERLAIIGANLWPRALDALARGSLQATPQSGDPIYAHKIEKSEARIDWTRSAQELDFHIRGLAPFPGAWCELDGRRVKIHLAGPETGSGQPGEILDDQLRIACGTGALRVLRLQPAGKPVMDAAEFLRGQQHSLRGQVFS